MIHQQGAAALSRGSPLPVNAWVIILSKSVFRADAYVKFLPG